MPLPFRTAKNLGLGILLTIISIISIFSYITLSQTNARIKKIILEQEVKLSRYSEVAELISDAKDYLTDYINKKRESVSGVILNIDDALKRINLLKDLNPTKEETRMLKELEEEAQYFQTNVLAYKKEAGQKTEQMALDSSANITQLIRAASQAIRQDIARQHEGVIAYTDITQRFLNFGILSAIIFTFVVSSLMMRALSYPVRQLFKGIKEVSSGNLDYKINATSGDEFGRIMAAFNQMAASLKNAEEERIQKNQFIETITQGIEEGLMLLNSDFKILWSNKKVIDGSGGKGGDVIGNYCYKITHLRDEPCKGPEDICPLSEVAKTGKPITVLHTHFDKEGNKSYVEVSVYPVKDTGGKVVQFIHVSHDVTEKIKMVEELKTAKNKIENYSRTLEDKVTERTKDLMESIRESDERRRAITNMLEDINEAHKQLAKTNQELKEAQAKLIQSAKMAAVGQLAGGVAHEINNPLTGVLNNIQLIKLESEANKDLVLSPDLKGLLDIIEESALRCKRITQGLLDFSRVGKKPYQATSINEVVEKALQLAEYEIKLEGAKVIKELNPEIPLLIADPNQLQQIILNILNNAKWAVHNTQGVAEKTAQIRVKTFASGDNKYIIVEISDNGCGIEKEDLSHMFEPFFTTKKPGEGTGLGLSICYGIIKEHGGTIEVESEGKDKGATFRISLPVTS